MWTRVALCLACASPVHSQEDPAAAIDWLREALSQPVPVVQPQVLPGAAPAQIETTVLDAPSSNAVGLLPRQITGLPADTFVNSDPLRLAALIDGLTPARLPAVQDLQVMLLLAELEMPPGPAADTALLEARVAKLVSFGDVEKAQALIEAADWRRPGLFDLALDIVLLTGQDAATCASLSDRPGLSQNLTARAFCFARTGDASAAFVTLDTGRAVGAIDPVDLDLLSRFLDPDAYEDAAPPPVPTPMTPLRFRLLDGLGETPDTHALPLPYAAADLRATMGWKARLEAAERLARTTALSPEALRGLYTERLPAASGGVWDRAEAFQRFDTAMSARDPGAIVNTLPGAWSAMEQAGLERPFARLFAEDLLALPLPGAAQTLVYKIGLLSNRYEDTALAAQKAQARLLPRDAFAVAIASGAPGDARALGQIARSIAAGFALPAPQGTLGALLDRGRLGEALLVATQTLSAGAQSDPGDMTQAIALFNTVGLRSTARETALQLLLLDSAR